MDQSQFSHSNSIESKQASAVFSAFVESIAGWSSDCGPDSLENCDSLTLSAGEVVYNSGWNQAAGQAGAENPVRGMQEAEVH